MLTFSSLSFFARAIKAPVYFVITTIAGSLLFAAETKALELEVKTLAGKYQSSSNIEADSDGYSLSADLTVLEKINKTTTGYVRLLGDLAQPKEDESLYLPYAVDFGARFYGTPFSEKFTPYLATSLNFRHKQDLCRVTSSESSQCKIYATSLRIAGGMKAQFSKKIYFILETNFTNAPLFERRVYPDDKSSMAFGIKLAAAKTNLSDSLSFGFGVKL